MGRVKAYEIAVIDLVEVDDSDRIAVLGTRRSIAVYCVCPGLVGLAL